MVSLATMKPPLFVYVKNSAVKESETTFDFIKFTLEHAGEMAEVVGYVSLPDEKYKASLETLEGLK